MITTLSGSNNFLLRRKIDQLVDNFISKHGDLAVEKIDAEEVEVTQIMGAVQSLPFLAERKLIVIRSLSTNKTAAEQIEQIISAAGESTELVFFEPATDKRTSFYKTLKQKTNFHEFNELEEREVTSWLAKEADELGGGIEKADAEYLVQRIGTNQELLANELAKLVTYNKQVTKDSIDLLTEPTPQSRIFDLLDASFGGDKLRALKLYEDQRAQKVEPQAILAMIAWQLQLITLAKYGRRRSIMQIARDSGTSPYPINKAAKLASKLSQEKVRTMIDEAFTIDWRSKTTNLDLDEALKNYILTL